MPIKVSKDIIDDLVSKYSLIDNTILSDIENIINIAIKAINMRDIEYFYNDSSFYSYGPTGYQRRIKNVKVDLKLIFDILRKYLVNRESSRYLRLYLKYVHSLIYARVVKILENGDWIVEFTDDYTGKILSAVCLYQDQMVTERNDKSIINKQLYFYVKKVEVKYIEDVMNIVMTVSRNSISLLNLLLKKFLVENNLNIKFKVISRISGRYSEVIADQEIPKHILACVSKLLNKEVIVAKKKETKIAEQFLYTAR